MAIRRVIGGVRKDVTPPSFPPGGHTLPIASSGPQSWPVARETKSSGWQDEADKLLAERAASSKKPFIAPTPDALDSAAHYLASVVCFESQHHDPPPAWPYRMPCDTCFLWAFDHMQSLATHRIPKQEEVHEPRNEAKKPEAKARGQRRGKPARKPAGKRRH